MSLADYYRRELGLPVKQLDLSGYAAPILSYTVKVTITF